MSEKRPRLLYYCDETSQLDTFMGIGGLALDLEVAELIRHDLSKINYSYEVTSEIKWTTAKKRRNSAHIAYIDLLFELIAANMVNFHIRFQEMDNYNHRLRGNRNRIDTVSKAHYQLLLHRATRYYGGQYDLHIRPDNGVCTYRLPSFKRALNSEAVRVFRHPVGCVRTIEPRDSKATPFLQLLDVTLGALTAFRNGRHLLPETSEMKKRLAIYAFEKTGLQSLEGSTPIARSNLSVWNVRPKIGPLRGPRG